ncbi:DUF3025 domain-containing protein [Thiobacillus sp.]|uniref:DUF3025 domain-containing protein n=1 Tax=Thiobacillus sp. TaxID=924 RepID=UPI00341ED4B6
MSARDYETHILQTGQVPTRAETWHDVLNALVWLRFPRIQGCVECGSWQCDCRRDRANPRPPPRCTDGAGRVRRMGDQPRSVMAGPAGRARLAATVLGPSACG